LIEREYASKYLETLKIDTTQKNINLILKYHPLKKCKINASWNNSGLYADTITIVARKNKKNQAENDEFEKEDNSDMLLKKLTDSIQGKHTKNLKNSSLVEEGKKEKETDKANTNENTNKKEKNPNVKNPTRNLPNKGNPNDQKDNNPNHIIPEEDEYDRKFHLDYSVESIKNKYIFPFNQTLKRSKKLFFNICFLLKAREKSRLKGFL